MTRVTVGTGNIEANARTQSVAASGDGRYVVFDSYATNLVADDTNGVPDIFLRDTLTGTTTRISVDTTGGNANALSSSPTISDDGRTIIYHSQASDLVDGDANGATDVFMWDVQTGTTTLVSIPAGGGQGDNGSGNTDVSGGGRYVVFNSSATNMVDGDTNGQVDIFIRDLQTGTTTRVSVGDDEAQSNGMSLNGRVSDDGQRVAFISRATNLVAGDTNGDDDIFVRDLAAGTTERVSVATDGTQANDYSDQASISGNGRYVVFQSAATNLVANDTNGVVDVFLRDLQTDTTVRVSTSGAGVEATGASNGADISSDGRYVVFSSQASNLVAGDSGTTYDVFVKDMQTGTVTRLSVAPDGTAGDSDSFQARISSDGSTVVFRSAATNLDIGPDTNSNIDGFRVSLRATAGADHRIGSDGNDTLDGLAGADILTGASGDDTLNGGAGADRLYGGDGSDTADYSGSATAVTVSLKTGSASGGDAQGDTLISIEDLTGSARADGLYGDSGANRLNGGAGDDALWGGAGADSLDGGAGTDSAGYQLSAAAVTVDLLAGTGSGGDAEGDTLVNIEALYGSIYDDQLTGNAVGNTLRGDFGNDTLVGNGGADTLVGDAGNDSLDGGDGNDRLVGLDGVDTIHGGNDNDSVDGGDGNDIVFGDAGVDSLGGNTGDDQLDGGDGNDSLEGGAGADVLTGGAGFDAATYIGSGTAVTVNLALGTASGGDAQGDTFNGIEQVIGSAYADRLTGDADANALWGQDGDDLLAGGAGADTLKGGNGIDTVTYAGSAAGVTINLATGAVSGGDAQGDTLDSIEQVSGSNQGDQLTGNAGANALWGGSGNDVLDGGDGWDTVVGGVGDDQLIGGAGGDLLVGGAGADHLTGGADADTASYSDSAVGVTINLATGVNTGGTAEGDTIDTDIETISGSSHDDVMTGNALGNVLIGFDGNDTLSGGGGNDTLRGGAGADVLNGGSGDDYFSYTAASDSTASAADTIQDFQAGDLISVRTIDADGNTGNGDTAFSFIGTGAFTSVAGQLRYEIAGGTTTISADVDGNGAADIVITLTGAIALQASDLLL